jgi:polyisoprenyl-teichoic acid--peptidoglycan teichoic acid transferase
VSAVRNNRLGWWIVGAVLVVLVAGGGIAFAVKSRSAGEPAAAPTPAASTPAAVIPSTPATAPPPPPGADLKGPLDLLILGVDTRVTIPDWEPHSDALMLLHVEPDLKSGYLYSLPRDLRVRMPKFAKAGFAGGNYKITEAMSRGSRVPGSKKTNVAQGYELLTKTLTAYTGIKQFQAGAILNFGGLQKLTDVLGGVDLVVDEKVKSHHRKPDGSLRPLRPGGGDYLGPQKIYQPGRQHLVGWQAIDYARQRYGLDDGDYDRQRHQRQLVKALLTKALSQGLTADPAKLQHVIEALGKTFVYVGGRSPAEYAYALRDLSPSKITLVGLPGAGVYGGGGYQGEALKPEGRGFLTAVAHDRIAPYLTTHPKLINKG